MQGLTVECDAESVDVPERTSGMFARSLSNSARVASSAQASAARVTPPPHRTARSELVTLAVVVSMTQLVAVTARAVSWLGRGGARARSDRPKGV